jgi:ketosteroid isomerase-like protein
VARNIETITRSFIASLGARDLESLLELFAETVDWAIPGNETKAPSLGVRRSKAEICEFFKLLWRSTEPVDAAIHETFSNAHSAVIAGEFATKMIATRKVVRSIFFVHLSEQNGRITRYRLLEDSFAVSESLS